MNYTKAMEFEWDDDKSEQCFHQRGFDFAYVLPAFFDSNRLVVEDTRWEYGESRYQLLGCVEKRIFAIVYTTRSNVIRVISARKANQREVNRYEKAR